MSCDSMRVDPILQAPLSCRIPQVERKYEAFKTVQATFLDVDGLIDCESVSHLQISIFL